MPKPALSFAAVPGRRHRTVELATEIERRGFTGLFCPSFGDGIALCQELAHATSKIPFGTSIANIYMRHPHDYAQTVAFLHEISGGRFRFGIGVSHAPANDRLGIKTGTPLADMRRFVSDQLLHLMSDRWLSDVTLFGTASHVKDGVERWRAAGVTTPILVPSSTRGGQMEAFEELFAAYAS